MLSMDLVTALSLVAQVLFVVSSIVFALSAIDDLFIDFYFALRFKGRRLRRIMGGHQPAHTSELLNCQQQPIALMLPAWSESDVIYPAVRSFIQRVNYANFHIFVGTYPNDAATQREVDKLTHEFTNVHKVVTMLPGPTCKGDCLNAIVSAIHRFERHHGFEFVGVVMQDAEDVVHPLSLRLFNFLLPQFDLIQIPVFSLKRKWNELTGGHYMDEFAEFHSKEIRVREEFAGVVPGAGVGTAYSRRALALSAQQGEVFSTRSLTEDYEFSFRMREAGLKQTFVRVKLDPSQESPRRDQHSNGVASYIATREYFPNQFWAAVRQKTRWTIGIALQGWKNFGWRGNWRIRYLFFRDRKMLAFSHAILLGYASLAIFSLLSLYHALDSDGYVLSPLLASNHPLWYVVYFNIAVLVHRLVQRHIWTYLHYGASALIMVLPRYMWGALVNYFAICRALKTFAVHQVTGQPIGWDKTAHDFPAEFALDDALVSSP